MVRGVPSLAMLRPAAAAAAMLLVAPPLHVLPSARRPLHVPTEAHAIVPAIRSAVCRQQPSATRHRPAQAVLADPEEAFALFDDTAMALAPLASADRKLVDRLVVRLRGSTDRVRSIVLADAGDLTPKMFGLLIKGLRQRRSWRACLATCEYLRVHEPHKLTNMHLTVAFGACTDVGEWEGAALLLESLVAESSDKSRLQPDLKTINSAIQACAAAGALDEALRLLREAPPRMGLRADSFSYCVLLQAMGRAADGDAALALFDEMRASGARPNAHVYSAAMCALRRGGRPLDALRLFDVCLLEDGIRPDAHCFGAVLSACNHVGNSEHHQRALQLYELSAQLGVRPTRVIWNEALTACCRAGEWSPEFGEQSCAERCLEILDAAAAAGELDAAMYNQVLNRIDGPSSPSISLRLPPSLSASSPLISLRISQVLNRFDGTAEGDRLFRSALESQACDLAAISHHLPSPP